MNTKEKIISEIETLPESSLTEILTYIQQLKKTEANTNDNDIWNVYLNSKEERKEVYCRLAES